MIKRPDLTPLKDTFWNNCLDNPIDLGKESRADVLCLLTNPITAEISPIRIPVVELFWFYEEFY
jgi:hypothetical protein